MTAPAATIMHPANHQVFLITGYYDNNPEDVGLLHAIGASPISLTDMVSSILPDFSVSMMLSLDDLHGVVDQLEQRALQLQVEESQLFYVAGHTPGDMAPYRSVAVVASSVADAMAGAAGSMPGFSPLGALNLTTYRSLLDDMIRCKTMGTAHIKEDGF